MPESSQTNTPDGLKNSYEFPIDYIVNVDTPTFYANNMIAHAGDYETFLLFFDTMPVLTYGDEEMVRAMLEATKSVKAKCVARIAVSKELIPKIIEALEEHRVKIGAAKARAVTEQKTQSK